MNNLLNVSFYDDEVAVINHNGEPYVPMRPIIDNMGLAWKPQYVKLKERFSSVVTILTTTGKDGKSYKMLCLPLKKLFGWMMTISPNKVKPQLKEKIIQYQNECDDVLWDYWKDKLFSKQAELNQMYHVESLSKEKGSFHGRGLYQRKLEKNVNEPIIERLQREAQPDLFIEATA